MRSTILSLATLIVIAACSDDRPTSPSNHGISSPTGTAADKIPTLPAMGKPADQVGFTKTFVVTGNLAGLTRGVNDVAASVATCPAGSLIVGGGYETYDNEIYGVTDLRFTQNRPSPNDQPTKWAVSGRMVGDTDTKELFYAFAVCAQ